MQVRVDVENMLCRQMVLPLDHDWPALHSLDGWAGYLGGNDATLRGGGNPLPSLADGSKPAIYRLETLNLMPNGDYQRAEFAFAARLHLVENSCAQNPLDDYRSVALRAAGGGRRGIVFFG